MEYIAYYFYPRGPPTSNTSMDFLSARDRIRDKIIDGLYREGHAASVSIGDITRDSPPSSKLIIPHRNYQRVEIHTICPLRQEVIDKLSQGGRVTMGNRTFNSFPSLAFERKNRRKRKHSAKAA